MIINTSLIDADLTSLITLADQEITDRGLTARSALQLQRVSMFITASMACFRDPTSRSIGEYKDALRNPEDYRAEAERIIASGGDIPFMALNEPIEDEE